MNKAAETMEHPIIKETDKLTPEDCSERGSSLITPQSGCASCGWQGVAAGVSPNGAAVTSYAYAIGRVEARFPNLATEKEFAQATGRADTAGKT